MKTVRITAVRQTFYPDLMAQYENPLETPCEISVGQTWLSENGGKPASLCQSAWDTMKPFVQTLAQGGGNFYGGWMKDPHTALVSCNDGFRPVSFYLEVVGENHR